ncbi:TPA: hypothetical protein I9137_001425 [Clostridium perfringens]|nr:hypothetical protein [Clostridium perfringens]HAT4351845.1 hypothetical protein [Clostridium perfringens]
MRKADLVKELNKFSKKSLIETLIDVKLQRPSSYETLLLIAKEMRLIY